MKNYKVLKEYIEPPTAHHVKVGTQIAYRAYEELKHEEQLFFDGLIKNGFIEEIPEQPKTVWDLDENEICYYIAASGQIYHMNWSFENEPLREAGSIFMAEKEAEKELARRKAKQILLRDTKGFKPNWGACNYGVAVYWDVYDNKLAYNWAEYNDGTIRFATDEDAEASIKSHEREWKTYLGVEGK